MGEEVELVLVEDRRVCDPANELADALAPPSIRQEQRRRDHRARRLGFVMLLEQRERFDASALLRIGWCNTNTQCNESAVGADQSRRTRGPSSGSAERPILSPRRSRSNRLRRP